MFAVDTSLARLPSFVWLSKRENAIIKIVDTQQPPFVAARRSALRVWHGRHAWTRAAGNLGCSVAGRQLPELRGDVG